MLNLMISVKCLLPDKVTYIQVSGIGAGTSSGTTAQSATGTIFVRREK